METIYIVMPAYNEAENIKETIKQWYPIVEDLSKQGVEAKLVIANDGSKDNTLEIMNEQKGDHPFFLPLDKPNSGHGATVLYLYHYAVEKGVDYIFQTDSDGQTDPNDFWQMWRDRDHFDFLFGDRQGRQDGLSRVFVAKVLRLFVWLVFHVWVKDANTPFRLMKSEKLRPILEVIPKGYFLSNVAVSAIAVKWNYAIGWYKVSFKPRRAGVNSINMKQIIRIGRKALVDFKAINRKL
ncbi:MAG: glycosyltransferase family 2 protein [Prevotella sp.]|nr:glycosyltransferase family 2 protein [Prevotella sp.]